MSCDIHIIYATSHDVEDRMFLALWYALALERKKYHCGVDSWQGGLFMKQLKK
jgi:hypothetical protein